MIFELLRFYVKSILKILKEPFTICSIFQSSKLGEKLLSQNFGASEFENSKTEHFETLDLPILVSRKI